jgi:type I restriction enzyme, R subunit
MLPAMTDAADDNTYLTAEARARVKIDARLKASGFGVQNYQSMNLYAQEGVAVREFRMAPGHGTSDYLLFIDAHAVGVAEAKKTGETLSKVESQTGKYSVGLPENLEAPRRPLPFLYETTDNEIQFTNLLDPEPRSRRVFGFHRPETMARWLREADLTPEAPSLRARLQILPDLSRTGLWDAQYRALRAIEASLARNDPRMLVQMTMGAGKTTLAVAEAYRLIKFGGAHRVLFMVDRGHLGKHALEEFEKFVTPDDGRKFTELYSVQRLTSNTINPAAKVVICTVQRLYSILRGEADLDPELEELDPEEVAPKVPVTVGYTPAVLPEFFDFIFIDEGHRSIFGVWSQVLEYFDAFQIGLTATPTKQALGFFDQNLVFEYSHPEAVANRVNVDFDVYDLRTRITAKGSVVEAGIVTKFRNRVTRELRTELLDEDFTYDGKALDRVAVSDDQIRTVWEHLRDVYQTEIFPGRKEFPKTLVFAKDESHAEDIVRIIRLVFGKGNDFVKKITYKPTDGDPETLISEMRNSFNPRIAVTVNLIATGTDIKALEMLVFMRTVDSPSHFEQMKGRGIRVIDDTDLQAVSGADAIKDRFVIVDTVGVMRQDRQETIPLDRKPTVPLDRLLQRVANGDRTLELASTLASRLARLNQRLTKHDREELTTAAGGVEISELVRGLVESIDPDHQLEVAVAEGSAEPTVEQLMRIEHRLIEAALKPLASNPDLRKKIIDVRKSYEQLIDQTSQDEVLSSGFSVDAKLRATQMVQSWKQYIEDNKDGITALQILYSRPFGQRLTHPEIKELASAIGRPPFSWTPERLWKAYETLDKSRVHGSGRRMLTDLVSLVRFALEQENELVPFSEKVRQRFDNWVMQQEQTGRTFTPEQLVWLDRIRDHLATSLTIEPDDFGYVPFVEHGGLGAATDAFGSELPKLLSDLNEAVAA